jgi:hypothetical protein
MNDEATATPNEATQPATAAPHPEEMRGTVEFKLGNFATITARGRTGGRKPVVTADKLKRARALVAKGLTVREAATRLKVGKTVLYEALR